MRRLIAFFILVLAGEAFGQSLEIVEYDASDFPNMRAKFVAYEQSGTRARNIDLNAIKVTENGQERDVTFVSCPDDDITPISGIIVIDGSKSMEGEHFEIIKGAVKKWINGLLANKAECAISKFNVGSYREQNFTTNKSKLISALDDIDFYGRTDYHAAFLCPYTGALVIAEEAKYKKVIILVTDGITEGEALPIIKQAKKIDATVHCVVVQDACQPLLQEIADSTGGQWFEHINTPEEAERIYLDILADEQAKSSCTVEWRSEEACFAESREVTVTCKPIAASDKFNYEVPEQGLLNFSISPRKVVFGEIDTGDTDTAKITFFSEKKDVEIFSISSTNPNFTVTPQTLNLIAGSEEQINVTYTATDDSYNFTKITIESDYCEEVIYCSAGSADKSNTTLKLISPNGGEKYLVGTDSQIAWSGVFPDDTLQIYLSRNNGRHWENIAEKAENFEFKWDNIEGPPSDSCLIKVTQTANRKLNMIRSQCAGGANIDEFSAIIEDEQGNYITVGSTFSYDGTIPKHYGDCDILICLWDKKLNLLKSKIIGGNNEDRALDFISTTDGGYILVGSSKSNDMDLPGNNGNRDCLVTKLNSEFGIEWIKNYGGSQIDVASSVAEGANGSYYILGYSFSDDGDFSGNLGNSDIVLLHIDNSGSILKQKRWGGTENDFGRKVLVNNLGNVVVVGDTYSDNGSMKGNHGFSDIVFFKISSNFDIVAQNIIGGNGKDLATDVMQTSDGNFLITGYSDSDHMDCPANSGKEDAWAFLTSPSGVLQKTVHLGGSENDCAVKAMQTQTGDFFIAGYTGSTDGDFVTDTEKDRSVDAWLTKLDPALHKLWTNRYGGQKNDYATSAMLTSESRLLLTGSTNSTDNGISAKYGSKDAWVLQLEKEQYMQTDTSDNVFSIVIPTCETVKNLDIRKAVVGYSKDSIFTAVIKNTGLYPCRIDNIYISGQDAGKFTLLSCRGKFSLNPGEEDNVELRFSPTEVRPHTALLIVETQANTLKCTISGEGIENILELQYESLDLGLVELRDSVEQTHSFLYNPSNQKVTIDSAVIVSSTGDEYTFVPEPGNFVLEPKSFAHDLTVRFKPVVNGAAPAEIRFYYPYPNSPLITRLYGMGIGCRVFVQDFEAAPDETTTLKISSDLKTYKRFKEVVDSYSMKIKFENSLLFPVNPDLTEECRNDSAIVVINGKINPDADYLAAVDMYAALGRTKQTDIEIESIVWYNENDEVVQYDATKECGYFSLTNLCYAGGVRLLEETGITRDKMIEFSPNPARDEITIKLNLAEKGYTEVTVSDILGRNVKQLFNEVVSERGERIIKCNISELGTGQYYIIFSSPGYKRSVNLQIVR